VCVYILRMKKNQRKRGSLIDAVPDEFDALVTCCSKRPDQRTEAEIQNAINLVLGKDGAFFRSLRRERVSVEDSDKRTPAEKARILITKAKLIRIKGSEVLVRQGNVPSRKPFYLVWSGELLLYKDETVDSFGVGRTPSVPVTKTTKTFHSTVDQELTKLRHDIRTANVDEKYIRFRKTLLIQQFGPKAVEQMDRIENARRQEKELLAIEARERAMAARNIRKEFGIRDGDVAEGQAFGELEMITGEEYQVSAVGRHAIAGMDEPGVATGAVVLALSFDDYSMIWPARSERMKSCIWMIQLPLFRCYSTDDALRLLNAGERERYLPRKQICTAGQVSDKVYIVYEGECRVVRKISANKVLKAASTGGTWSEANEQQKEEQEKMSGLVAVEHRVEKVLANKAVKRVAGFGGLSLEHPHSHTPHEAEPAKRKPTDSSPMVGSQRRHLPGREEDPVRGSICAGDIEVDVSILRKGEMFGQWGVAFPGQPELDHVITSSLGKCHVLAIPAYEFGKCKMLEHEKREFLKALRHTAAVREAQTRTAGKLKRVQVMGRIHAARVPEPSDHLFPSSIWSQVAAEQEEAQHRSFSHEVESESSADPFHREAKFMHPDQSSVFIDAAGDSGTGFAALNRVVDKNFILREYSSKGKGLGKQYFMSDLPDVKRLKRPIRRTLDSEVQEVMNLRKEPVLLSEQDREHLNFREPDVPMTRGTSSRDALVKGKLVQALGLFGEFRTLSRVVVSNKSMHDRDSTLDLSEFLAILHKCKLILKRGHLAGMTEGDAVTLTDACAVFNRVNRGFLGKANDTHELDYEEFAQTLLEIAYILAVPPPDEVVSLLQETSLMVDAHGQSAQLFASMHDVPSVAIENTLAGPQESEPEDSLLVKSTHLDLQERPQSREGQRRRPRTTEPRSRPGTSDPNDRRPGTDQRQRRRGMSGGRKPSADVFLLESDSDAKSSEVETWRQDEGEGDGAHREELVLDWDNPSTNRYVGNESSANMRVGSENSVPFARPQSSTGIPYDLNWQPSKTKSKSWASPFEKYLNKRPKTGNAGKMIHVGIQMIAPAPTAVRSRPCEPLRECLITSMPI